MNRYPTTQIERTASNLHSLSKYCRLLVPCLSLALSACAGSPASSSSSDLSNSSSNSSQMSSSSQSSSNIIQSSHSSSMDSSTNSVGSSSSSTDSNSSTSNDQPPKVIYAINAGGPNYTSQSGLFFEGDGYARNGKNASTEDLISNTEDPTLFQTEAWGRNLSYELPVSNGTYSLTLYMVETYHEAANERVLDISIEGSTLLSNLDLFNEVGHDNATEYKFDDVLVTDGTLNLNLTGQSGNGKLSALIVKSVTGSRSKRQFMPGAESIAFQHRTNRPVHRIPAIIKTASGRIFAGVESRESGSDHSEKEVVIIQSDDGGRTWSNQTVLGDKDRSPTGNPTFVFDTKENRLILFYAAYDGSEGNASNNRVFYRYSDSQGSTWSDEIELSHLIPNDYSLALPGPGHGIQMKVKYEDRLVIPFWGYKSGRSTIFGLFSDDHGLTWNFGYQSSYEDSGAYAPNETQIIEQDNGDILVIARTAIADSEFGPGMSRAKAISKDGGESITPLHHSSQFSGPIVMGSVIRMSDRLLFSAPLHNSARENMGIRESFNNGQTWSYPKQISSGFAAYSDLVALDEDTFGIIYEIDGYQRLLFKSFNTTSLNTQSTELSDKSPADSEAFLFSNKSEGVNAGIINDGKFGKAVLLDGDSHISVTKTATNLLGDSDFSVNLWYNSNTDFTGQETLLWFFTLGSARDALWTRFYPNYIRTLVNQNGEQFFDYNTGTVADNNWHMLTLVRNNNSLVFYIDGVQKSVQDGYFSNPRFGENTDIGYIFGAKPNNKSTTGFNEEFNGKLDEISMYKRALDPAEIEELLNNGNVSSNAQILHLSFDE